MKKEGIILFLVVFLVLSACLVAAQDADAKVTKAYSCLNDKVKDKCDSLSVEEKAFVSMATGKCTSELIESSQNEECWPSSGCKIRDTALAVLALRRNSKDTKKAEDWLVSKEAITSDLIWYLEIDSQNETVCKVSYKDSSHEVTVRSDKKMSGSAGTCLSIDAGGYWLKIDADCYSENFTISCDKDFVTALLYKKKSGATVYVSSKTNFGSAEGSTEEKVNGVCFGTGCDYEGSSWAALALSETGHDISPYLPYLIAMAEENKKYFPSAFLYDLTEYDEFFSEIADLQVNRYWKITDSPYDTFYDTSLALLAMQGINAEAQIAPAKEYLLDVQQENGCWNDNVRDTAFILYAAWPKSPSAPPSTDYCEDAHYFCVSPLNCESVDVISSLPCRESAGKICCKQEIKPETCAEQGGKLCTGNEECDGTRKVASDTSSSQECCEGNCVTPKPPTPECEQKNDSYHCRTSCDTTTEEIKPSSSSPYDCNSGEKCCGPKPKPKPSYWWIWLLIILIILVALGIVFRNRLRVFIFQIQDKMKRGKGAPPPSQGSMGRFPPTPPPQAPGRPASRMIMPRQQQVPRPGQQPGRPMPPLQPRRVAATKTDKELEETLKKLKAMSK